MSSITKFINDIKNAVYGKDVRKSIADAIETCYDDATALGNTNMEISKARGNYSNLNDRLDTEITSVLNATTDLQNQINAEKSRIDELSSLEEGSTTGDAELQDIRTGYDGTTYGNAGTAVREQIRKLNEDAIALANTRRYSTADTRSTYMLRQGIVNTLGGFNSSYQYALMSVKLAKKSNETIMRIKCDGYYIRAARVHSDNEGQTILDKLYDYTQNQVVVKYDNAIEQSLIVFCIRKNPSDSTALTQEDIDDIHSKLEVYTNNIIDKTLTLDNAAANAETVGRKLDEIKEAIKESVEYEETIEINYVPRWNC